MLTEKVTRTVHVQAVNVPLRSQIKVSPEIEVKRFEIRQSSHLLVKRKCASVVQRESGRNVFGSAQSFSSLSTI